MSGSGQRAPDVARIRDYLLGGKDNYAEDRQFADSLLAVVPDAQAAARASQQFLSRAVRFLAGEAGIGQFINMGTGFPAAPNVHEVAQDSRPPSRVVYVDNDPVVVAHARALLCTAPGVCAIQGDLRDLAGILDHPEVRALVDPGEPTGFLLPTVLHFIPDEDGPRKLVEMLMAAAAPGSYLVLSHATAEEIGPEVAGEVRELYTDGTAPAVFRSRDEIARFFEGLELAPPGISDVAAWRPSVPPIKASRVIVLGGAGRKP
jgi:S-adenosyl methyltransferase